MPTTDAYRAVTPNSHAPLPTPPEMTGLRWSDHFTAAKTSRLHESAALASAFDDGLMPDDVSQILAGRRIVEAFPVRWGESPETYASRAVSEMFVAYLQ
jgi:hypothetical protein